MKRYGVPSTAQIPEFRKKQLETMEANYGAHYFASVQGKAEIRDVMKERYDVLFAAQIEGYDAKAKATFMAKYGVEHPLQLEYFNEKRFATCLQRYGTPFPGRPLKGPNLVEALVWDMAPNLLFTGDGAYWKRLPNLKVFKNPDFVLPGPVPENPYSGVSRVVEVFGNYWHSQLFTGKACFAHEQELIDAFKLIGIACLVLWESEIKSDLEGIRSRLTNFLL